MSAPIPEPMTYELAQSVLTGLLEVTIPASAALIGFAAVRNGLRELLRPDRTLISLREQMRQLEQRLNQAPPDLRRLGQLEARNAVLEQNCAQLEALVADLQQRLRQQNSTLQGMVGEKQQLLSQLSGLAGQNRQLTADVERLTTEVTERQEALEELAVEREELIDAMELAQLGQIQADQSREQTEAERDRLARRLESLEQQIASLTQQQASDQTQLEETRAQLRSLLRQGIARQAGVRPQTVQRWLDKG